VQLDGHDPLLNRHSRVAPLPGGHRHRAPIVVAVTAATTERPRGQRRGRGPRGRGGEEAEGDGAAAGGCAEDGGEGPRTRRRGRRSAAERAIASLVAEAARLPRHWRSWSWGGEWRRRRRGGLGFVRVLVSDSEGGQKIRRGEKIWT
jgi:hypothetical protein